MKCGVGLLDICDRFLGGMKVSLLSLGIELNFLWSLEMKISGLQKVSTLDYPGESCWVVFLHGCNFRCGFCYNSELVLGCGVPDDLITENDGFSEEYVLDFLKNRVGKLDGVCISGGEPLMSLDFDFVRKIKAMGFKVKVDTNGSFPSQIKGLIDEGLVDYIAMDVKSSKDGYCDVVGVDADLSKIEESIKIVNEFGGEFRTTVVSRLHSKDSIVEMAKWVREVCGGKPRRFFLQGFKNKGKMIDSSFDGEDNVSEKDLLEMKDLVEEYFGEVDIRV